jgi:hypothetical protein
MHAQVAHVNVLRIIFSRRRLEEARGFMVPP